MELLNIKVIENYAYKYILKREKKKIKGLSIWHEIEFKVVTAWSIRVESENTALKTFSNNLWDTNAYFFVSKVH